MKKIITAFFMTVLLCTLLAVPSFAANLEGDADACATALRELGLFMGTDKGFELERPMTRAEAAAMLVRFFGAEKKALSGNYRHPFTDVPAWADKYVGWLYVSGLTKGVSPTLYGSRQAVTAWQYATFITRALKEDEEIPQDLITQEDIASIDGGKKFIRADAAIMSVRALACQYTKNENYRPLADVCIERGLFTAQTFGDACYPFFSASYCFDSDGRITLRILGIDIRVSSDGGYFVFQAIDPIASDGTRFHPFVYRRDGKSIIICTLNPLTLEVTELAERANIPENCNYNNPFKLGDTHLIFETLTDANKTSLLAVKDGEVRELLSFTVASEDVWYPNPGENAFIDAESVLVMTDSKYYRITEAGHTETDAKKLTVLAYSDGHILAQRTNDTSVDVILIDVKDGKEKASYSAPDDIKRDSYGYGARYLDRQRENWFYGEAGLYCYSAGDLTRITEHPANDFIKKDDGSYIILTHSPGNRYPGIASFGGNEVLQIFPDGTEKYLTPENMDTAAIDRIFLKDGRVHFVTASGVGMMHFDMYTYRIEEDGTLTVTDFSAGRPEVMNGFTWDNPDGYKQGYIKTEQERIDALGY